MDAREVRLGVWGQAHRRAGVAARLALVIALPIVAGSSCVTPVLLTDRDLYVGVIVQDDASPESAVSVRAVGMRVGASGFALGAMREERIQLEATDDGTHAYTRSMTVFTGDAAIEQARRMGNENSKGRTK
jgi:hypothetical protein